jgi:hypothetical protein
MRSGFIESTLTSLRMVKVRVEFPTQCLMFLLDHQTIRPSSFYRDGQTLYLIAANSKKNCNIVMCPSTEIGLRRSRGSIADIVRSIKSRFFVIKQFVPPLFIGMGKPSI